MKGLSRVFDQVTSLRLSDSCFLLQKLKMGVVELIFFLFFLYPVGLTGQEEKVHALHFHFHNPDQSSSIGVSVNDTDIPIISSTILAAENWLKSHVLAHFPSTNITVILLGRNILCSPGHEHERSLILPSMKNLYHSLTRWGLQEEIKVSTAFSSDCLDPLNFYHRFRGVDNRITLIHLLGFLKKNNLPYIIDSSPYLSPLFLYSSHRAALERLGLSGIRDIRVLTAMKPITRKLYSYSSAYFPQKPKGLTPSQFAPVPDSSLSFSPYSSPDEIPTNPPEAVGVPTPGCLPVAAPVPGEAEESNGGLWCVAKPTVPAEKLQEAINYACGEGGVDCEEIKPNGMCYFPDNVIAHASYAFNSYWQLKKQMGGSCSFDGTAILINSDPSIFLMSSYYLTGLVVLTAAMSYFGIGISIF
ncbi:Glucan endo-1,3-beta-glucosidase 4 [Dendrobium catenatum]|uniref:Glucan endo-1,3-beta-glucosidase 4 n=1 Tax=Dendrobium catenatum TaxID=906689 RepID=A0A2I0V7U5_9ASPA|nr:Glucan endo-1,3-beta-glucosidase 4 [Dendrobium catenatum]